MTQTTYYDDFPAMEPARLSHVATLLTCYPRLSEDEVEQISSFIRTASIIDLSLLKADPTVSVQLVRFKEDKRADLGLQPYDYLALAVIVATITVTVMFHV